MMMMKFWLDYTFGPTNVLTRAQGRRQNKGTVKMICTMLCAGKALHILLGKDHGYRGQKDLDYTVLLAVYL